MKNVEMDIKIEIPVEGDRIYLKDPEFQWFSVIENFLYQRYNHGQP